jgi:hypothetical protein
MLNVDIILMEFINKMWWYSIDMANNDDECQKNIEKLIIKIGQKVEPPNSDKNPNTLLENRDNSLYNKNLDLTTIKNQNQNQNQNDVNLTTSANDYVNSSNQTQAKKIDNRDRNKQLESANNKSLDPSDILKRVDAVVKNNETKEAEKKAAAETKAEEVTTRKQTIMTSILQKYNLSNLLGNVTNFISNPDLFVAKLFKTNSDAKNNKIENDTKVKILKETYDTVYDKKEETITNFMKGCLENVECVEMINKIKISINPSKVKKEKKRQSISSSGFGLGGSLKKSQNSNSKSKRKSRNHLATPFQKVSLSKPFSKVAKVSFLVTLKRTRKMKKLKCEKSKKRRY